MAKKSLEMVLQRKHLKIKDIKNMIKIFLPISCSSQNPPWKHYAHLLACTKIEPTSMGSQLSNFLLFSLKDCVLIAHCQAT